MIRIETIKEKLEMMGNVMHCNSFGKADLDSILKRIDKKDDVKEYMFFVSPWMFGEITAILAVDNCIVSKGVFKVTDQDPVRYMVDTSFSRGSFEFHVIVKPIEDSYILPVDGKEDHTFYKNCVLIRQE